MKEFHRVLQVERAGHGHSLTLVPGIESIRSTVMASSANCLKLAEELGGNKRPLSWAMAMALVVSLASAVCMLLNMASEAGGALIGLT